MSGFLLDTNCISELVRPKPDRRVVEWMDAADESILYLSVLTLGEIRKGLAGLSQSKRRAHLDTWLETGLRARFAERVLPVNAPIADTTINRYALIAGVVVAVVIVIVLLVILGLVFGRH